MQLQSRPSFRQWLLLGIALVFLNAAVTFQNVWPTPWITTRHELSIELALLLLGLAVYAEAAARLRWPAPGPRVAAGLTALLFVLCVGRYADVTSPALYGRPVNLYWDAQHLPKVAAMLVEVAQPWLVAAIATGAIALCSLLATAFYFALAQVARGLQARASRLALGALAASIVAAYVLGNSFDLRSQYWFSVPVAATYRDQIAFIVQARSARTGRELPLVPLEPSNLGRVQGADVLLMFLESYGAVTYDSPEVYEIVAPARAELESAAADTGRELVSAFVESPTFGGSSWLAHATLLSGFEVREPDDYDLLLTQHRETLPALFAASGYRALALMPGLKNAWPEGAYYGFDSILGEQDIDYRGPAFGWWRIPDQFSLAKLDEIALSGPRPSPAFVFFPTINTHIPFRPTPPYQPDWSRVTTAHPFDEAQIAASIAKAPDWTSLRGPYAESFAYTLRYLGGYLRERPNEDLVLVLVGDHQPAASVSGVGARWDVPVHVITSRAAIAASLRDAGFVDGVGLAPRQAHVGSMGDLTTLLLRAFDSGGRAPGYIAGRDPVPAP